MSENHQNPLTMSVAPQANIIDRHGTSIPARTASDAHKVLVQTASLQGGSIMVKQQGYKASEPALGNTIIIHADRSVVDEVEDVPSAEWTVNYHSWIVTVPGQSSYLVPSIETALNDAQLLANSQNRAVAVHVADIKTNGGAEFEELVEPVRQPQAAPAAPPAPEIKAARADAPAGPDESAAIRFSRAKQPAPTGPAQIGVRGVMNRSLFTKLGPGQREQQLRSWRNAIQRGLDSHKTISEMNIKGGVGKTTTTFLLAATIGRIRGGNVVAWDNNENQGNLAERAATANHDRTVIDLLDNIDEVRSPGGAERLVNYVRPQGENKFHVLSSANKAGNHARIDRDTFGDAHAALREFYHLTLIDTGNATNASTWEATADAADILVIVTTNKEDGARKAFATIDDLISKGHKDKLANGIAIINQPSNANAERLQRIIDGMKAHVRDCVVIPFDPALDDGDEIVYEALNTRTKEAYMNAAALIIDGL